MSPRAVVAMDKFRDSADAAALNDVAAGVLRAAGWAVDTVPVSDGGEGFRRCFPGEVITLSVHDAYGTLREVPATCFEESGRRVAVLETAEIVGRSLPDPTGEQAWKASSAGVGEAVVALGALGVEKILLGAGGSATSDGGEGCYDVVLRAGGLPCAVVVATDVTARFAGALGFAEQKGIAVEDLLTLATRLTTQAQRYRAERGIDVESMDRAGAAGGLAGALAVWGASLREGFAVVAHQTGLVQRVEGCDLVVTGEGRLDRGSLQGKVVDRVCALHDAAPVMVLCGAADDDARLALQSRYPLALVLSLVERFGTERATTETLACVHEELTSLFGSTPTF